MAALRLRGWFGWLLLAFVLGAAAALAGNAPDRASAHALLVRADPPVNASLPEPPSQLTLYFSEPLERRFSAVRVVDQTGQRVEQAVEFDDADDTVMRVGLPTLSPGYVTVIWETVSAVDGHRISGSYPLTILNPDGSLPAGSPSTVGVSVTGEEAEPGRVVTRLFLLVGAVLLTGAFAFLVWVVPSLPLQPDGQREEVLARLRLAILAALVVLFVAGAVDLILQARDIDASLGATLDTRWGERWLLRNLILLHAALALLALWRPSGHVVRAAGVLGLAGAITYLGVAASVNHAAAGEGAFWAVAADFVHFLTASVWFGMLACLALLFLWARGALPRGERYPVLAPALKRFSIAAFLSMALLLFSGVLNAVIEVARLSDLVNTGYGQALLLKLILIVPLLGLAGTNAYLWRPEYVETSESPAGRARNRLEELEQALLRTMRFELLVALAVLAVVALLVQLTPTRGQVATSAQAGGKFIETAEASGIAVTFVIDPNQPGINSFEVYLSGAVNTVESVRLNFDPPGRDAEPSRLVMEPSNPPTFYVGRGPFIAEPGRWRIEADLRRNVGSDLAIPFTVNVAGAGGDQTSSGRGGTFAAPVDLTTPRLALIAGSALLMIGLVAGSVARPGLPSGYLGLLVENVIDRVGPIRPRPAFSLLALVVIGVGLGLVLGSHLHNPVTPEQASEGNLVPTSPESIARGREIFLSSCVQCHGESGRGDGPLARSLPIPPANLYDHIPYHPDQFFFQVITNGLSGVMPAFGSQLSEEDRWNVLNYLRDQFGQPVPEQ